MRDETYTGQAVTITIHAGRCIRWAVAAAARNKLARSRPEVSPHLWMRCEGRWTKKCRQCRTRGINLKVSCATRARRWTRRPQRNIFASRGTSRMPNL